MGSRPTVSPHWVDPQLTVMAGCSPPPPLPLHVSLTDLFLQRNMLEASQQLRHMSDLQAREELLPAFTVVPNAPTAFLQCVTVLASVSTVSQSSSTSQC